MKTPFFAALVCILPLSIDAQAVGQTSPQRTYPVHRLQQRQQTFHFGHRFFPLPLVDFGGSPTTRTSLVFGFASELDGKVQFGPDVLCQFNGFEMSGFILSPVASTLHGSATRSFYALGVWNSENAGMGQNAP
jgi:hypothetical protein